MTKLLTLAIFIFSAAITLANPVNCSRLVSGEVQLTEVEKAQPTIVIVDGYSSGRLLAPDFKSAGFQVVHVHSHGKPPKANYQKTFKATDYDFDITGTTQVESIVEQLASFQNIVGVETGADSGVFLTDELRLALKERFPKLPADKLDRAKKDKSKQGERLREHGLDSILEITTSSKAEALQFVRENNLFGGKSKTVVVKPINSASGDGVTFSKSEKEVADAIDDLINKNDEFGKANLEILVQEFLEGVEYVVNTRSHNGHHIVTDIWKYKKRLGPDGIHMVYDYDILIPNEGDVQQQLIEYTLNVLAALSIENGNGHGEVMMVPGRGPVLVEMNSRMMGSGQPELSELATGHGQVDRTVLAYSDPEKFAQLNGNYKINKYAAVVTLTAWKDGQLLREDVDQLIQAVPGYQSHSLNYKSLEKVDLSIDLNTAIGDIFILADDLPSLMASIEQLRALADSGGLTRAP